MGSDLRVRLLAVHDRASARALLEERASDNLVLLDLVDRLGALRTGGELAPQVHGVFDAGRLVTVASLRPIIVLSSGTSDEAVETLLPLLARTPSGLIKTERGLAERLWGVLERRGRRALIDRVEVAHCLRPDRLVAAEASLPGFARPARPDDLDDLIYAARASLWEEDRPDPSDGDPVGFRRWVESRLGRARVVCDRGRIVFVAYADVRRSEGWLIQGVYTWPEARRQGFARRGMDSVVREAFAAGASHVQLAVVEGNQRAMALYRNLGFEPFGELRTILYQ